MSLRMWILDGWAREHIKDFLSTRRVFWSRCVSDKLFTGGVMRHTCVRCHYPAPINRRHSCRYNPYMRDRQRAVALMCGRS